jgi:hypothetical protein
MLYLLFWLSGFIVGGLSMLMFICLSGNLRTRTEQDAFLARERYIKEVQRRLTK